MKKQQKNQHNLSERKKKVIDILLLNSLSPDVAVGIRALHLMTVESKRFLL